jgi:diguanylate cyclase (GGDEF)-like protein
MVEKFSSTKEWDYYKDQLTGYYNRFALLEFLEQHSSSRLTIFAVNIDNFSSFNRMYGYLFSDILLKKIAQHLEQLKLSHMQFFRFDGDEFVYVTSQFMNFREIEEFSRALISFFNQVDIEIEKNGEEFAIKVSISVGVAMGGGIITLNHAQMAIKESRLNTKSSYHLFTSKSDFMKQQQENVYWINKIKNAIEEENLVAYYQPIKNIHTGKIEKFECLARINDDSVVVSPMRFMEAVRLTGSFALVTRTIIKNAFKEFANTDYEFSINITASDMKLGYLEKFLMLHVEKYNIDPSRIVLELLEDIVTLTEGDMIEQIEQLRKAGFQVAVDDFGMENSNFSRLLEFHPDYLKIDGAFIKNILESKKSQIIVDAIVDICKKSNIKVIAEFVSSQEVYEYLEKIGIDYAQGFLVGKPVERIEMVEN